MPHIIHVLQLSSASNAAFWNTGHNSPALYVCSVPEVTVVTQNATLEPRFYHSNLTLTISSAVQSYPLIYDIVERTMKLLLLHFDRFH